jgi:hypothetical protein
MGVSPPGGRPFGRLSPGSRKEYAMAAKQVQSIKIVFDPDGKNCEITALFDGGGDSGAIPLLGADALAIAQFFNLSKTKEFDTGTKKFTFHTFVD